MKVFFVETNATDLYKNFFSIAMQLKKTKKDFHAFFIANNAASYVNLNVENNAINKISQIEGFTYLTISENNIRKILIKHKPNLIFISGYRIYDMLWVGYGTEIEIPTFKIQHGFEVENLYYKPQIIFTRFYKVVKVLKMIYLLSKIIKVNFVKLTIQYGFHFFTDKPLICTKKKKNNYKIFPQKIFVYSEYYKKFWEKKYGLPIKNMVLISPDDFRLVPFVNNSKRKNSCCYIAQTLVEDGRMTKKEFEKNIIEKFIYLAQKIDTLLIKLHPRSDMSLYYDLLKVNNVFLVKDLPNTSIYISHYSSMVYLSYLFSNNIVLYELPKHPTPDIFKPVAKLITYDINEIADFINEHVNDPQPQIELQKEKINYYCYTETDNSLSIIVNEVLKLD